MFFVIHDNMTQTSMRTLETSTISASTNDLPRNLSQAYLTQTNPNCIHVHYCTLSQYCIKDQLAWCKRILDRLRARAHYAYTDTTSATLEGKDTVKEINEIIDAVMVWLVAPIGFAVVVALWVLAGTGAL